MISVVSIAGSDSSGGAGIQADIRTISAFGMFPQTAVTALTAQNTTGVFGIDVIDPDFVARQIDVIFSDIMPNAVKIGMIPTPECAISVAEALKRNSARNIVLDPVITATSGFTLSGSGAIDFVLNEIGPLADIITPNIPEAEAISGRSIRSEVDMAEAAEDIRERIHSENCIAILVKGGHLSTEDIPNEEPEGNLHACDDVLLDKDGSVIRLKGRRIDNRNTHGTGCTLSSAIACGLAAGYTAAEACRKAKDYITLVIGRGLNLGKGRGPMDHIGV